MVRKEIMGYGTYSRYIDPVKKDREIYVGKNLKGSIENLKRILDDNDYYSSVRLETTDLFTGRIIETHTIECDKFEADIICDDCFPLGDQTRLERLICVVATAIAAPRPFVIKCPRCGTDYMQLVRDLHKTHSGTETTL